MSILDDYLPHTPKQPETVRALRAEVAALTQQVARLENDLTEVTQRNRQLTDLASSQDERLRAAQTENEAAYRHAYDAASGPHFCPNSPFGELVARPRPGISDIAKGDL